MFNGPIPGQSLTTPPKQYPWERPPEMVDPEEVLQYYLERLTKAETMGSIMDALELDMSIKALTEGMLRTGVSKGLHTIDVSLIIAPVIHDYIKSFADELGVEYDEGWVDKKEEEKKAKTRTYLKTKRKLEKMMQRGTLKETPKASSETKENYKEEGTLEETPNEAPKGFLARRK